MAKKRSLSKYLPIGILVIVAVVVAVALMAGGDETKPKPNTQASTSACGPYRDDTTVKINGAVFKTEVPKNHQEFTQGLGGRPCILANQAMLFRFTKPGQYPFWMKDMKFPIDIIWIGPDFKVAADEIDVQPSTYPDRFVNKDHPAQYVLEVKANRSHDLNIDIGTPVSF